jgi:hypothetical protein
MIEAGDALIRQATYTAQPPLLMLTPCREMGAIVILAVYAIAQQLPRVHYNVAFGHVTVMHGGCRCTRPGRLLAPQPPPQATSIPPRCLLHADGEAVAPAGRGVAPARPHRTAAVFVDVCWEPAAHAVTRRPPRPPTDASGMPVSVCGAGCKPARRSAARSGRHMDIGATVLACALQARRRL